MKNEEQNQRRMKWRKIVDDYVNSAMTQKAYCEHHKLSLAQFAYYYSLIKQQKKSSPAKASFMPVNIHQPEVPAVKNEIKLSLPNGLQCTFSSHTDTVQIKRLVEVLLSC